MAVADSAVVRVLLRSDRRGIKNFALTCVQYLEIADPSNRAGPGFRGRCGRCLWGCPGGCVIGFGFLFQVLSILEEIRVLGSS